MAKRQPVRCPRCGSAARAGDDRCPRCGALLASVLSAPPFAEDTSGIPIQRFASSVAGPPIAPEPFAQPDLLTIAARPRPRILSYGVVRPLTRRKRRAGLLSLLALVILVIAGLAIGVGAQSASGLARDALP